MADPVPNDRRSIPVTALQLFWGACALAGLVSVGWAAPHTSGAEDFFTDIRASWSAITVSLDLLFLGIPVVAYAVIESRRIGMRFPWIWIPLAIPLPGAFLISLFFLLRERALIRARLDT